MKAAVEKRDGASVWNARQAAYDKLVPLIWKQLLLQAEQYANFLMLTNAYGFMDASLMRKDEELNGQGAFAKTGGGQGEDTRNLARTRKARKAGVGHRRWNRNKRHSEARLDVLCR